MNYYYLLLQVPTPKLIESQSNEIQLIYFFGGVIVLGLISAIAYLKVTLNKKEDKIEKLILSIHENEKANITVLKDMVSIIKQNYLSSSTLEKLIMQTTNPDIKAILKELENK